MRYAVILGGMIGKKAIVTGACGLIGSEVAVFLATKGFAVTGVDSNHRAVFFGPEGDTSWSLQRLRQEIPDYQHEPIDIRDRDRVRRLVAEVRPHLIVHTAAEPSHDRAAAIPFLDFEVNALGTLNLLEAARQSCPESPFVFTSTKQGLWRQAQHNQSQRVCYALGLRRCGLRTRYRRDFQYRSEQALMSGASKLAADVMVQEYGRYFNMPTCCLRGGCLTGPNHSGVELHGFLSFF